MCVGIGSECVAASGSARLEVLGLPTRHRWTNTVPSHMTTIRCTLHGLKAIATKRSCASRQWCKSFHNSAKVPKVALRVTNGIYTTPPREPICTLVGSKSDAANACLHLSTLGAFYNQGLHPQRHCDEKELSKDFGIGSKLVTTNGCSHMLPTYASILVCTQ